MTRRNRRGAEAAARRELTPRLRDSLRLLNGCEDLLRRQALRWAEDHSDHGIPIYRTMFSRIADDLRALSLCVRSGYPAPAMVLAASVLELCYLAGAIAAADDGVTTWNEWQDLEQGPFWS
jgi:hypothetical protein